MSKIYTLIYQRDEDYGSMGFRIKGSKEIAGAYNMATEGLLIAHDIIEHSSIKDIGTMGDELKALGAIWYVRGKWGDMRRDNVGSAFSAEENIASDIVNMGRSIVLGERRYNAKIPRFTACEARESLKSIVDFARQDLPNELREEDWKRGELDKYLTIALKFMIQGYNHAKRRYQYKYGNMAANNIFWAITEAVDQALKFTYMEGQQIKLCVNMKTARAYCKEVFEEEY